MSKYFIKFFTEVVFLIINIYLFMRGIHLKCFFNFMENTPFTYKLIFKPTGQYYYGVRFAKGCHPSDLWDKYFTSSKHIHKLIKEYGLNSFSFKIMKTFTTEQAAIAHEYNVLTRVKADKNGKFINKTISKAIPSNSGLIIIHHSIIGCETFHDPELPIPCGWLKGISDKHRSSLSNIRKGKPNPNKGKKGKSKHPCSEERKTSISRSRMNTPKITCKYCDKNIDPGNFKRFHGDNCKFNPNIDQSKLKELSLKNKLSYDKQVTNGTFNKPKPIIGLFTCPHCQKTGINYGAMNRHHFDNCPKFSDNLLH
jgi:hypothetical protein